MNLKTNKIMKKLNGFESHLVISGLIEVRNQMIMDIRSLEKEGKAPLMTVSYVEMIVDETIAKIKALTLKQK
jgi:hypothetical protein